MYSPIIIASLPRSGSSLAAKIFAEHGVEVGKCEQANQHNPDGFYQNIAMEEVHRNVFGPRVHKGVPAEPYNGFRELIETRLDMDMQKPWLVKFSAMYLPPWIEAFPDAKVMVPRRNIEDIVASGQRSGLFKAKKDSKTVQEHLKLMDEHGDKQWWYEDLMDGYYAHLVDALKYCGLEPNEGTIAQAIRSK